MGRFILAKLIFGLLSHSGLFWLTLGECFSVKSMWGILLCQSQEARIPWLYLERNPDPINKQKFDKCQKAEWDQNTKLLPSNHFLTANHWRFSTIWRPYSLRIGSPVLSLSKVVFLMMTHNAWYNLTQYRKLESVKLKWKGKRVLFFSLFQSRTKTKRDLCVFCYWTYISRNLSMKSTTRSPSLCETAEIELWS